MEEKFMTIEKLSEPEEPVQEEEPVEAEPQEPVEGEEELKEQLSVVKEVRSELAKAYETHKEQLSEIEGMKSTVEQLQKERDEAFVSVEQLQAELDAIKARDAEAERLAYNKRLERLSTQFGKLGQNKPVKELEKLSKEVIAEFESITGAALANMSEEKLMVETTPTESMPQAKPQKAEVPQKDFFEGICDTLGSQQTATGGDSRRTINL